jgi:hypothetical protein
MPGCRFALDKDDVVGETPTIGCRHHLICRILVPPMETGPLVQVPCADGRTSCLRVFDWFTDLRLYGAWIGRRDTEFVINS